MSASRPDRLYDVLEARGLVPTSQASVIGRALAVASGIGKHAYTAQADYIVEHRQTIEAALAAGHRVAEGTPTTKRAAGQAIATLAIQRGIDVESAARLVRERLAVPSLHARLVAARAWESDPRQLPAGDEVALLIAT